MRRLAWMAPCALVAVAACKGHGPACAEVTDHILKVTMAAMPAHDGMKLANKQQMTEHCEKDLSADERQCFMDATDLNGFGKCRKSATVPPPAAPNGQGAAPPAPAPAPPAPSGTSGSAP